MLPMSPAAIAEHLERRRVRDMNTRRFTVIERPRSINIGNMVQKLRRIRTELAQMTQQIDDALARIDDEKAA